MYKFSSFSPDAQTIVFEVSNMACSHCKNTIEKAVYDLPGVKEVEAIVEQKKIYVTFEPDKVKKDVIKKSIEDAGYEVG